MTITNHIYERARAQPDATALVHNGIAVSYLTFARAIETHRLFFESKGLTARGPVVVAVGNIADAWFIVLALQALGFDTLCAPSVAAVKALNLKHMACLVVTQTEQTGHDLDKEIAQAAPFVIVPGMQPLALASDQLPNLMGKAGGHILYTSGTTGQNKKLLLDAAMVEKRAARQAAIRSLGPETIQHCGSFGLWVAAGWSLPVDGWMTGGMVVIDQRSDSAARFFEQKINMALMTPPLLRALLDQRGRDVAPVEGFELAVISGFLSLDLAEQARAHLATVIKIGYGASECTAMASGAFQSEEDLHWLEPRDDRELEVVDMDDKPCLPGEEGRIRVKLMDGDCTSYLDDAEATARVFQNGYFYPGDLGVFRADGRFRLLGRAGDVLNMQGQKVPVAPLESELQMALGVNAVCLFSGLSLDGKDELVVVIEGRTPPNQPQVEAVRRGFARFERVRFECLDTFPRTKGGTQKVMRDALRRRVFPQ